MPLSCNLGTLTCWNPLGHSGPVMGLIYLLDMYIRPVPVAAPSKRWVCGRSPAEIVGSNPTGGHRYLSVVSVVCCQVEVSATS